jgi:hypothetical protein
MGCRTLIGGGKQNPLSSRTDRGHGSSLTVVEGANRRASTSKAICFDTLWKGLTNSNPA